MSKKAAKPKAQKAGNPKFKRGDVSAAKWLEARKQWEADDRISASLIAEEFGTTWRAVKERINVEGWTRESQKRMALYVPKPKPRPPWRPPSLREGYADQLIEYFREPVFATVQDPEGKNPLDRSAITDMRKQFPTLGDFATRIGVTRETLHDWATKVDIKGKLRFPAFAYAYKASKAFQEHYLANGGLAGKFQPAFAIFASKNIIGWRDQIEVSEGEGGDRAYPVRAELDDIYAKALEKRREQNEEIRLKKLEVAGKAKVK